MTNEARSPLSSFAMADRRHGDRRQLDPSVRGTTESGWRYYARELGGPRNGDARARPAADRRTGK